MKSPMWLCVVFVSLVSCAPGADDVLVSTVTPEPTATLAATAVRAGADVLDVSDLVGSGHIDSVVVRGFVVWNDNAARLCEALAESFPPQCGGLSITILNPEELDVALEEAEGVRWTQGFVDITGRYDTQAGIILAGP